MIKVENICMRYNGDVALRNISFNVEEGDFIGVLGPNGAGKSTLFKIILGLIKPQMGRVHVQEHVKISYVPQSAGFEKKFPISVQDVVLMGMLSSKIRFFKRNSKEETERAHEVMKRLKIFDIRNKQIGELSGGQLQKVLIARALAKDPHIILLDEPTASLDSASKKEIFEVLKELNNEITILIVSHNISLAGDYITKSLIIDEEVKYFGKTDKNRLLAMKNDYAS